jgi:hypothetical protein
MSVAGCACAVAEKLNASTTTIKNICTTPSQMVIISRGAELLNLHSGIPFAVPRVGLQATPEKKMSYPQGSALSLDRLAVKISPQCFGQVEWNPMSSGAVMAEAVVPFAPKSNSKSEANDQLDRAGQAILAALHRGAGAAEANYQQAVEMTHKLSAQLRATEDRIRQLEATVRHHEGRADRAEK